MKKIISLFIILTLSVYSFSQNNFIASFLLDKMNVIYTSVDNPITIYKNFSSDDLEYKISGNAKIIGTVLNYYIQVSEEGTYYLTIKQKSTGNTAMYGLRAKKLPTPFANINDIFGDTITQNKLIEAKQLDLTYIPAFDWNIKAEIESFALLKITGLNERVESRNFTSTFSKETKKIINSCNSGDILIFRNIKAKGLDPEILKIADLLLYVK